MSIQKKRAKKMERRGRPATGQTPQRILRVDDELWGRITAAAAAAGLTTSAWIRRTLDAAADIEARMPRG